MHFGYTLTNYSKTFRCKMLTYALNWAHAIKIGKRCFSFIVTYSLHLTYSIWLDLSANTSIKHAYGSKWFTKYNNGNEDDYDSEVVYFV